MTGKNKALAIWFRCASALSILGWDLSYLLTASLNAEYLFHVRDTPFSSSFRRWRILGTSLAGWARICGDCCMK